VRGNRHRFLEGLELFGGDDLLSVRQRTMRGEALDVGASVAQTCRMKSSGLLEFEDADRARFARAIVPEGHPAVFRGLVRSWPIFSAASQSIGALAAYLKRLDSGQPVSTMLAGPEVRGRYFYDDTMRGFNFEQGQVGLSTVIDKLLEIAEDESPASVYAGSTQAAEVTPAFATGNVMPLLDPSIQPRLWLGNRSRVSAHYDIANNIACVVSGKRRFTLFSPDQIGNLYVGPLDFNMAGQPASLVDFENPDFERFPKFRDALDVAYVVDLEPGDAIYIPSLWWHHVEADGPFNLLVNYWWPGPGDGPAFESLVLALFGIRDRAPAERDAWKAFFDHYVFGEDAAHAGDHIPEHARSVLGPPSEERSRKMLNFVMTRLSQR
jgi:Cupin-like domain